MQGCWERATATDASIELVNRFLSCIIWGAHNEGWFQDQNLLPNWRFEVRRNGWATDEIDLQWLQMSLSLGQRAVRLV
jgi:hypothetical protein